MRVNTLPEQTDRCLFADISKWAHAAGWRNAGWRGWQNARYEDEATVVVRLNETGFEVWRKNGESHFTGRPMEYPAATVREAVDLLAALRILPPQFSSAYVVGVAVGYLYDEMVVAL